MEYFRLLKAADLKENQSIAVDIFAEADSEGTVTISIYMTNSEQITNELCNILIKLYTQTHRSKKPWSIFQVVKYFK